MITTSSTLDDVPATPASVTDVEVLAETLLTQLDASMTQLFQLHVQGEYVKRDDVADVLLDFRQKIHLYSSRSN